VAGRINPRIWSRVSEDRVKPKYHRDRRKSAAQPQADDGTETTAAGVRQDELGGEQVPP
jgi:hypothetical protein